MLHVRRREHIRGLSREQSVLQEPGGAEREADRRSRARDLELAPRLDEGCRRLPAANTEATSAIRAVASAANASVTIAAAPIVD